MDDPRPSPVEPAPTREELLALEGTGWDGSLDDLRRDPVTPV